MACCAAYNCFNNSSRKGRHGQGRVTFHKFPKDGDLCKKWIESLRLQTFFLTDNKRICSEHFLRECYQRHPIFMESLGFSNERMLLKEGIIPTVFDRGTPKGRKQLKGFVHFKPIAAKSLCPSLIAKKSPFGNVKISRTRR
eukprot:gene20923-22978_t